MKIRMKKLISLGLIVSIFSNSLLIVRAENSYQNNTEYSTIYSKMYSIDENMEYGSVKETQEEKQTEQPIDKKDSTSGQNELELQNKKGFLISSEKIELQVGEKARFYIISMSDNSECFPVITLSDSSLAQVSEVALEKASEEENGKALLENAPSNAKWYEVTANVAGNVSVTVEYEGVQKEIQILIHGAEIDENAEENTAHENETILSQRISDGWSQDGLYYYIDGVPVKGIAEIKGVLYYFDAGTGRLCKKAQWIDQDGKRYFCNAEGILYRNQFIKFGTIYYYMGSDGSMQTGIVKVNDGRLYYMGEDGTVQKKAQWIERDGKRYFCNAEGILYRNQFIKFGTIYYYMGSDGSMQTGIVKVNDGRLYYMGEDGTVQKKAQWIERGGKRYFCNAEGILYQNRFIKFGTIYYYMGSDGSMQTGIVKANDGRLYYMGEDGTVQKKAQWIEQGGKRYFCNAEGVLYKNQFIKFGTIYYYMGSDGSMQTGIVKANDGRLYYIGEDGTVQKKAQWIEQDGKRYFCNAQGIIYQNQVITFGNIWYCMGEDGSVQYGIAKAGGKYYNTDKVTGIVIKKAGWIEANGKRYFSKADGNLYQNQFIKFGETYYYCGSDAAIIKSTTQAVNGVLYRFDSNGIIIKEGGWGEYKGNKYYKNPITGFPYKNQWVTFGRTWYYANANGFMVSGWQTIGGYKYYFYSDTKYMARNTVIDGICIGDDGRVVAYGTRMSSFTTVSTNNANGTYNMSKALKSFNQVVIQPGQTISFFDIAGPCGKAEGYLPAGVVGGIGYGGGICQASTTLYGAALRAGLTIVERRNHSVPSTYVPIGQDAMVNYGSSDLKIRNDFNFPVKLVTYTKGKTLYAEVWGTQPSWYDYISIESWWSGSRSAVAYRKYIKNGQVVKTEQLPSSYY